MVTDQDIQIMGYDDKVSSYIPIIQISYTEIHLQSASLFLFSQRTTIVYLQNDLPNSDVADISTHLEHQWTRPAVFNEGAS